LQIQNIFSRVTGNSVSNIDGVLRANGTANLFLLNPNGIIFGAGASLNVGGSFLATTANAIGFGNLGFFSASAPNVPSSLLTVNPSALLFNQLTPAPITSQSIAPAGFDPRGATYGLRVPDGRSLLLVGGDINVDGLGIGDPVNEVNGGGLKAYGGRIELGGLAGAGSVGLVVDGNNLSLSFPIAVVRANVSLTNAADVKVLAGGGGSIAVNAENFSMAGESQLRAGIDSGLGSSGSIGGNIEINTTGVINLSNLSLLNNSMEEGARGQGGGTNITTSQLLVSGGSQIAAGTIGAGNVGNLTVIATESVQVIGESADRQFASGLYATVAPGGKGAGGELSIDTGRLIVRDGAQVATGTFGEGSSGNLRVNATESVELVGTTADGQFPSGLLATVEPGGKGAGGNLSIDTGRLIVRDGAGVSTATFGEGQGGNLKVKATDSVEVTGRGLDGSPSGLSARTETAYDAGTLSVETGRLVVGDGAQITVSSTSAGKAGTLDLKAESILLSNQASLQANTTGGGGNISLTTPLLLLRRGSNITTNAQGSDIPGGNITINTDNLVAVPKENSDITANSQDGRGGNIKINTSGIFGIEFRNALTPLSDITATGNDSSLNGNVEIDIRDVNPSTGLAALPTNLVDRTNQIDQGCSAGGANAENKFAVTGRGGLPSSPNELFAPDMVQDDLGTPVASHPPTSKSVSPTPTSPPKQLVEAQGWVVDDNGVVTLVAAAPNVTPHSGALVPASCQSKGDNRKSR
jgi:filamentous hemagglutinin family protein